MNLRTYIHLAIVFGAIVIVMGLLAGCASAPADCPPIEKPVEVKVPVEVPCKAPTVAKPTLETVPAGTPDGVAGIGVKVRVLLDNLDLMTAYSAQLEAANAACQ